MDRKYVLTVSSASLTANIILVMIQKCYSMAVGSVANGKKAL